MSGVTQREWELGARADVTFRPSPDAQVAFRVVLDTMARPGTLGFLPAGDRDAPVASTAGLCAIGRTLLDHEVTVAVVADAAAANDADAESLAAYLHSTTGCRLVPLEDADYVLALGRVPAGVLVRLRRGQPAYPDEGATLVALVPPLSGAVGRPAHLSGPGVAPGTVATVPGWTADDLAALGEANAAPPLGIDVILVDAIGRVLCIPRSTRIRLHDGEVGNGLHGG